EIDRKFDQVRAEVMRPFGDQYATVVHDNKDAAEAHKPTKALPAPPDTLKPLAVRLGLTYEKTPLVSHREAEALVPIGSARVGTNAFDGPKFADELLDAKRAPFDSIDLTDEKGRVYLAWKIEEAAPRVPALSEIREQVVTAWKTLQARPIAEKAAS